MNVGRYLLSVGLLAGTLFILQGGASAQQTDLCANSHDLRLINGKIVTMDKQNSIVNEVTIQEGRFAIIGKVGDQKLNPCTKVIDLKGKTVVPGLIDNHNHVVLFGLRPGHDIRLERAATIAEAQAFISGRAKSVPAGAWVTSLGSWSPVQFAERRIPTLAELDAAAPNNPVLIGPLSGPGITNSLGKAFFESKQIPVSPTGVIAAGGRLNAAAGDPFGAAINALRAIQTFDDKVQGTLYAQSYMTSFGVTTSVDMGVFALPGTPDMKDSELIAHMESTNPWTAYDPIMKLHRDNKMTSRLRIFYIMMDKDPDVPLLKERLLNGYHDFGDDMLKVSGIGEFATTWTFGGGSFPSNYETALKLVAAHGWAFQQHSTSLAEDRFTTETFEKVNAVTPIADLRWSIAHVPAIDKATIERLKAIGAGVAVHPYQYMSAKRPGGEPSGPPLRMILDSGIHVGAGSDAAAGSALDPWLMMYYLVTGKNAGGELVNDGQQVTRAEALRLYTADNGWFFHEEDKLGSIEPGKLADLAVLNEDFLDPKKVSDEEIRHVQSVLTVVGGKIVYDSMR